MKISYYDLLGLIKEEKEPKEIEVQLVAQKSVNYVACYDRANGEFLNYYIKDDRNLSDDYHSYLTDSFLESSMFKKCIKIIEGNKEIQKLSYQQVGYENCDGSERKIKEVVIDFNKQIKQLGNKLNEVIEELKKIKKEGKKYENN